MSILGIFKSEPGLSLTPDQTSEFKKKYDEDQLVFVRVGLAIALVSYALYALSDGLAAPQAQDNLLLYRFLVVCPILGSFLLLTWFKPYSRLGQKAYCLHMTTMGYLHLILLSMLDPSDPGFNSYYGGLILIISGLGILGGLRVKYAALTGVLIFAGYQIVGIYGQSLLDSRLTKGIFIVNNLFLLTAICFAVLSSYLLQNYAERNFIKSLELKITVNALKRSENRLRSTLKEQVEWSSLFTRFIRHELSNSLTGASTSLQLIARKTDHEETLVYVKRAEKSLKDLRELLNKASDATSIDDAFQVAEKEIVNINELLDELIAQYSQADREKIISIQLATTEVEGSYILLTQLFHNLIENALRHAAENTQVSVIIGDDNSVSIENQGDPLPENIERLFDLGQTSQSGKTGLFGLGLYVVKKIVLAHGGSIKAEPLNGDSGARFTVAFKTNAPLEEYAR